MTLQQRAQSLHEQVLRLVETVQRDATCIDGTAATFRKAFACRHLLTAADALLDAANEVRTLHVEGGE